MRCGSPVSGAMLAADVIHLPSGDCGEDPGTPSVPCSAAACAVAVLRRLPKRRPSGRFPHLPFPPLARLSWYALLPAGRSQARAPKAGGWLRGATDRPAATPPSDRRAQALRARDTGRSACPCRREAPPASSSVPSQTDVPWEPIISRRGRERTQARDVPRSDAIVILSTIGASVAVQKSARESSVGGMVRPSVLSS